jgi:protein-tyrosine-phosphatase
VAERTADAPPATVDLLIVCTGNAARSVMAGCMLTYLAEAEGIGLRVTTAGTHAVDGQPPSLRTRNALETLGPLGDVTVSAHRSRQLSGADLGAADLVVAMEADHVRYVRRVHPEAAPRTATLRRLCADLPPGPPSLAARVSALRLDGAALADDEDVPDPAGREDDVYAACAAELWDLCRELAARL